MRALIRRVRRNCGLKYHTNALTAFTQFCEASICLYVRMFICQNVLALPCIITFRLCMCMCVCDVEYKNDIIIMRSHPQCKVGALHRPRCLRNWLYCQLNGSLHLWVFVSVAACVCVCRKITLGVRVACCCVQPRNVIGEKNTRLTGVLTHNTHSRRCAREFAFIDFNSSSAIFNREQKCFSILFCR